MIVISKCWLYMTMSNHKIMNIVVERIKETMLRSCYILFKNKDRKCVQLRHNQQLLCYHY